MSFLSVYIRSPWKEILSWWLISRVFLLFVGFFSRMWLEPYYGDWYEWHYSRWLFLDLWAVWDSGWYLEIAQFGYALDVVSDLPKKVCCGQANYVFYPAYPLLMRYLGMLLGNYLVAGLLISQACLLVASYWLYSLVALIYDEDLGLRTVKYLMIWPISFVFSGVLSEAMFLFFLVGCFYFGYRRRWFVVGLLGFGLSLTRSMGVLVVLPLLWCLYRELGSWRRLVVNWRFWWFGWFGLAVLLFNLFLYFLVGDFWAHPNLEHEAWGVGFVNPVGVLWRGLVSPDHFFERVVVVYCVVVGWLLWRGRRFLLAEWSLVGWLLFWMPLTIGDVALVSMMRYSVVLFPVYVVVARMTAGSRLREDLVTVFLVVLQGLAMVFWSNGIMII